MSELSARKRDVLVSVIIPVYNAEATIKRCLNSIQNQSISNLQIVLIDDFSSDHSMDIVKQFADEDKRIMFLRSSENKGAGASRNLGIDYAKGKYVFFADSDDYLENDCIEFLLDLIESHEEYDLAACSYYRNGLPVLTEKDIPIIWTQSEAVKAVADSSVDGVKGFLWNKLFRKSLIDEAHLRFDENIYICEDTIFCLEYLKCCSRIIFCGVPKYHYCTSENSITRVRKSWGGCNSRFMTVIPAHEKIKELCTDYQMEELNRQIDLNLWLSCISILDTCLFCFSEEQLRYGHTAFRSIRGHKMQIMKDSHLSIKRKVKFTFMVFIFELKEIFYKETYLG